MHKTKCDDVRGHMDERQVGDNYIILSGWCLSSTNDIKPLRFTAESGEHLPVSPLPRPDVCRFYKLNEIDCGWSVSVPLSHFPCCLEMETNPDQWNTVFTFCKPLENRFAIQQHPASYIVADNFYENPDAVRKFALSLDFKFHPNYHKGKRTDLCYRFDGLKERFEQIIGRKVINWEKYGTNGCFQYCIGGDQLVYHCDTQQYAGVLFLTPDAPVNTGTCLFRSIHTKKMKVSKEEHDHVFRNGFLDPTQFERVDTVGNVYNRLVLFDSLSIHAAAEYFGTNKENGRLFQLFFFDLE